MAIAQVIAGGRQYEDGFDTAAGDQQGRHHGAGAEGDEDPLGREDAADTYTQQVKTAETLYKC